MLIYFVAENSSEGAAHFHDIAALEKIPMSFKTKVNVGFAKGKYGFCHVLDIIFYLIRCQ